jgi:hypothetical protein
MYDINGVEMEKAGQFLELAAALPFLGKPSYYQAGMMRTCLGELSKGKFSLK